MKSKKHEIAEKMKKECKHCGSKKHSSSHCRKDEKRDEGEISTKKFKGEQEGEHMLATRNGNNRM